MAASSGSALETADLVRQAASFLHVTMDDPLEPRLAVLRDMGLTEDLVEEAVLLADRQAHPDYRLSPEEEKALREMRARAAQAVAAQTNTTRAASASATTTLSTVPMGSSSDLPAFEWIELQTPATRAPATPRRPSQIVHETFVATPQGQNIVVTLERTSTGGTRREGQFTRAAGGAMSEAVRAQKKRVRASLFPDLQAAGRKRHAGRERAARPKRKEKELQEGIEWSERLDEFCRQRGVTPATADYDEFDRLESERACMMRRVRKTRK
jgi:hypothetical protein